MDDHKQKVINSFKQGHLIDNYQNIPENNKLALNSELELLELDVVDHVIFKLNILELLQSC